MRLKANNVGKFIESISRFANSVKADHYWIRERRRKYQGQSIGAEKMFPHMVTMIGYQMAVAVRIMQLLRDCGIPLAPEVVSRMIRHLYAAEIHPEAEIAPGVTLVHGNGIVISRAARVAEECILFQNITLGLGVDPKTRESGAPTLQRNVHVGPGATLLGPITIGEGTKIMAGAVVTESVPPHCVVRPALSEVSARKPPKAAASN